MEICTSMYDLILFLAGVLAFLGFVGLVSLYLLWRRRR